MNLTYIGPVLQVDDTGEIFHIGDKIKFYNTCYERRIFGIIDEIIPQGIRVTTDYEPYYFFPYCDIDELEYSE